MVHARSLSAFGGLLVVCSLPVPGAGATTTNATGVFAGDDSSYELTFTDPGAVIFTASTTSFAGGGFVPVLTLFNDTSGAVIDNSGSGTSDASLNDVLDPGTYDLFLTEFPNVANGDLAAGFLFTGDPTITGDSCGVPGGMFYDTVTCTTGSSPRGDNYSLSVTTAPTPELPTWLLVLPPAALLCYSSRRRSTL